MRSLDVSVVGLVAVTLVVTGPMVGLVDVTARNPTTLGDGTAQASVATLDTGAFTIEPGRYGSDLSYLRIPDAVVAVEAASDRPKVVYQIRAPSLSIDADTSVLLGSNRPRTVRLSIRDRGRPPSVIGEGSHEVSVSVRIQSFEEYRTIYRRTVTVGVTE